MALRKTKVPMPEQPPEQRIRNFREVALGLTPQLAQEEAERCLQCKNPACEQGCPVNVRIKEFIGKLRGGDLEGAYRSIWSTNILPSICGRVCPQEEQCEKYCLMGKKNEPVAIGRLERYLGDWAREQGLTLAEKVAPNGKKVAVVGSGPAGLTCASDLAQKGYDVTIFEALHVPGGVLMYGIPEFRLPKAVVQAEIDGLRRLGVEIRTDVVVGKTLTVDDLFADGYRAVFLGTGAGLPNFLGIPGENLCGVYSANEFLTRINLMKGYLFPEYDTPVKCGRRVAVVGAGNVAMDAARCALRLGPDKVYIVYRRTWDEMPARREEIHHAKEEGIEFHLLTAPIEILGDEQGWVRGMVCQRMELGEPDASGRRRPVPILGSEYQLDVDTVIVAIGTTPNPLVARSTPGLQTTRWGGLIVDEETGMTTRPGVFAGGDSVTGAATVILAMGAGRRAAAGIDRYLSEGGKEG
ncbi:MAG: NADPH-dependent glutamate synthase [Bacillota bacterium]|nr:NADPH-dependent glutamate synthase [Bacillota bacterium]MDI7248484.1 NADPH-dependent glutamate synthase [Bacillota bacterium]